MNKIKLLLLATAASALLAGCINTDNKGETHSTPITYKTDTPQPSDPFGIDEEIRQVILKKARSYSPADSTLIKTFDDNETIALFNQVLQSAVPMPGILDPVQPDYQFELTSENSRHSFFLWLDESTEQAMLMDTEESHTGYTISKKATAELKKLLLEELVHEISIKPLSFQAVRQDDGSLAAKPADFEEGGYYMSDGPALELDGTIYHTVHLFYGDHKAINALVAHKRGTDEVQVKWSNRLNNSQNRWNNAFMSSYNLLLPLEDNRLLFLESELTEDAGAYHLSAYNPATGAVERLRENFWPISGDYDHIYQYKWNAEKQTLLMQSFLGNVWIFDLKTGQDIAHLNKFPVIPHSTSGLPSLFISPTLERFVFDDESGELTFYNYDGNALGKIKLTEGLQVPSDKIKWNPAGTAAWLEQAPQNGDRILGIDIDYLRIAPTQVQFFNPDGKPIGSLTSGDESNASLEVSGWINADVAVIKVYTAAPALEEGIEAGIKDASYFLYDVWKKNKGPILASMPPETIPVMDSRGTYDANKESLVKVTSDEVFYMK
ncbi:hypothetical protein A7K91_16120 [Paenibacillus oryzae]|uniref:YhfM-like domain-containing protein n=1 Tax=Paenibacillus oryzae TaxID=1844972 RepID=A0A1A5YES3_9BACL|nr:hypothetical protein [Paenibacillus oryzae]OBR64141.1 hypothetical protein A7K91_16120 [Paenibacillus oryzae]